MPYGAATDTPDKGPATGQKVTDGEPFDCCDLGSATSSFKPVSMGTRRAFEHFSNRCVLTLSHTLRGNKRVTFPMQRAARTAAILRA
jgi:hypothetical protein